MSIVFNCTLEDKKGKVYLFYLPGSENLNYLKKNNLLNLLGNHTGLT